MDSTWVLLLQVKIMLQASVLLFVASANLGVQAQPQIQLDTKPDLHAAAKAGNVEMVKNLLLLGVDINAKGDDGRTPLHVAAKYGNLEVAKALLESGARLEMKTKAGRTALHEAAENGQANVAKLLLDYNADVDATDNLKKTPLYFAAMKKHTNASLILLEKGADVNIKNSLGQTPLHRAIINKDLQLTKTLLSRGAKPNLKDSDGKTPLDKAKEEGLDALYQIMHGYCPYYHDETEFEMLSYSREENLLKIAGVPRETGDTCKPPKGTKEIKVLSVPVKDFPSHSGVSQKDPPRPPELRPVNCQSRITKFIWVAGSASTEQQRALSYTLYRNISYMAIEENSLKLKDYGAGDNLIYEDEVTLEPWTNQTFWVTGNNTAGASEPSEIIECQVPPTAPSKNPSKVAVTGTAQGGVHVTWEIVPPLDHQGPGFHYVVAWQEYNEEDFDDSNACEILREGIKSAETTGDKQESKHDSHQEISGESEDSEEPDNYFIPLEDNARSQQEITEWEKNETIVFGLNSERSYLFIVISQNNFGSAGAPCHTAISLLIEDADEGSREDLTEVNTDEAITLPRARVHNVTATTWIKETTESAKSELDLYRTTKLPLPSPTVSEINFKAELTSREDISNKSTHNEQSLSDSVPVSESIDITTADTHSKIDKGGTSSDLLNQTQKCPGGEKSVHGHSFNHSWVLKSTYANTSYQIPCPKTQEGLAEWQCLANGTWSVMPDVSNCGSKIFKNLETALENNTLTAADIITTAAANLSSHVISSGDVYKAGELLHDSYAKHRRDLKQAKDQKESRDLAKKYLNGTAEILDSTLEDSGVWKDLLENRRASTMTHIQEGLSKAANIYADYLHNETESNVKKSLNITVKNQPIKDFINVTLSFVHSKYNHTNITLPEKFYEGYEDEDNSVKVIFTAYKDLNCIGNAIPCSPDDVQPEHFPAAAQVNSPIIGAKIGNESSWKSSDDAIVVVTLKHIYSGEHFELGQSKCVWWDVNLDSWSGHGCRLVETNDFYSVCHCNHLTNLAIITDINGILDRKTVHYKAMQLITIIGCAISIFSLLLCIICFMYYSLKLNGKTRQRLFPRTNLCICLLIAQLVLLLGVDKTQEIAQCTGVAICLHYFFLATFVWSAIEAYFLYKNLINVFNTEGSRKKTFLAIGYLTPLVVVGITYAASQGEGYGHEKACWLDPKVGLTWAFTGVILPILIINMLIFIVVMKITWQRKRRGRKSNVSRVAGSFCAFFLLCLTWLFGFCYLNKGSEILAIVFTVFNSLQGTSIFIFSVILDNVIMGQKTKKTMGNGYCRQNHLRDKKLRDHRDDAFAENNQETVEETVTVDRSRILDNINGSTVSRSRVLDNINECTVNRNLGGVSRSCVLDNIKEGTVNRIKGSLSRSHVFDNNIEDAVKRNQGIVSRSRVLGNIIEGTKNRNKGTMSRSRVIDNINKGAVNRNYVLDSANEGTESRSHTQGNINISTANRSCVLDDINKDTASWSHTLDNVNEDAVSRNYDYGNMDEDAVSQSSDLDIATAIVSRSRILNNMTEDAVSKSRILGGINAAAVSRSRILSNINDAIVNRGHNSANPNKRSDILNNVDTESCYGEDNSGVPFSRGSTFINITTDTDSLSRKCNISSSVMYLKDRTDGVYDYIDTTPTSSEDYYQSPYTTSSSLSSGQVVDPAYDKSFSNDFSDDNCSEDSEEVCRSRYKSMEAPFGMEEMVLSPAALSTALHSRVEPTLKFLKPFCSAGNESLRELSLQQRVYEQNWDDVVRNCMDSSTSEYDW